MSEDNKKIVFEGHNALVNPMRSSKNNRVEIDVPEDQNHRVAPLVAFASDQRYRVIIEPIDKGE